MPDGNNPNSRPNSVTASRTVLVIKFAVIWGFELKILANGTSGGAELSWRLRTCQKIALTEHRYGSPLHLNPITSPHFLVIEGERGKPCLEDECNRVVEKIPLLLTIEKLDIRETKGGIFLVGVSVLPGQRRKKKAMTIISATTARKLFELVKCCATYTI